MLWRSNKTLLLLERQNIFKQASFISNTLALENSLIFSHPWKAGNNCRLKSVS
jgi:hypothetical protein